MKWFLVILIGGFGAAVYFYINRQRNLTEARRRGLYPEKGKATMFDVRRLILKKEKQLAIQLYGEIFQTSYKEAQKAVEELDRSIQEKNIEHQ